MQSDAISRSEHVAFLKSMKYPVDYPDDEYQRGYNCAMSDAIRHAKLNAPALDVAPVVHAHWIKTFGSDGFVSALRCSKCGNAENSTYIPGNFCWFCGARMDGEADG